MPISTMICGEGDEGSEATKGKCSISPDGPLRRALEVASKANQRPSVEADKFVRWV